MLATSCAVFGGDDAAPAGSSTTALSPDSDAGNPDTGNPDTGNPIRHPGDPELQARLDAIEFVEGPCEFEEPATLEPPRCGQVTVPSDWATGDGQVVLQIAVFAGPAGDSAADPVIYLDGGPGSHALDTLRFIDDSIITPLQSRGDVIFFDQRGAGRSEPRLDCPEVTESSRISEDTITEDDDESWDRFLLALTACSDRLRADGIDIGDYNSANNAHDVEAIRSALGYDEWNLYGISYGTRLGLEVMRRHPGPVRTAVLDSVFPPEVDSARDNPGSFLASYNEVVAACSRQPACAAEGDLGDRLTAIAEKYDAEPIRVEVRNFLTDETDDVYVTGDSLVSLVRGSLYSPSQFTDLPEVVAQLEAGDTDGLVQFLNQDRTNEEFFTAGMFYAFECNEEAVFSDEVEVAAAVPDDPFGLNPDGFLYSSNSGPNAFRTCEAYGWGSAPPEANDPVVSDIPSLVMAGHYDPVTPVAWAELAAANLENSHLVVHPDEAHGVSPGDCGMSIVTAFLAAPETTPDTACFAEAPLSFLGPAAEAIELETVTFTSLDVGPTLTILRPADWEVGDLIGDSYRQASFLDPTQLIQIGGPSALGDNLRQFLEEASSITLTAPEARNNVGGRDWLYQTGSSSSQIIDWYQTTVDSTVDNTVIIVIMVSTPDELESNRASILTPALEAITVGSS